MYALIAAGRTQPERYADVDDAIRAGRRAYGSMFAVAVVDVPESHATAPTRPLSAYAVLVSAMLARQVAADRAALAGVAEGTAE